MLKTRKDIFINFAIWSVVALFTSTQLYLRSLQSQDHDSWWNIFYVQLFVWWVWALITPLVYRFGYTYRIDQGNVVVRSIIHLLFAVATVVVYLGLYSAIWTYFNQDELTIDMVISIYVVLFLNLFHWHFFIYIAIVGLVHAKTYFDESRDRALKEFALEKELLSSQLKYLKMQLRPHFLFNTLNSIVSSIQQSKNEVAVNMTTDLSELLRISLTAPEQQINTLAKELDYVKKYLGIEQHRFKDLNVVYDIQDDLLQEELPNFILQPLVENAIQHGISKKTVANLIEVSAQGSEENLVFTVYNDGPPYNPSKDGIGLSNVRKRLAMIYGDKATFSVKSQQNGVKAEIRIKQ